MADKSLILLQQENLELQKENYALKETITKLLTEMNSVRGIDNKRNNVERITLSTEQRIIEEQIDYFEAISRERALSLEETRAFDLLIKNKRILDQNKVIEPDYTKVPEGKDESDLLRIAGDVESKTNKKRIKSKASSEDPLA